MKRTLVSALLPLLAAGSLLVMPVTGLARERPPKTITKGAQVAIVNLLNPEVMHYHAARDSNDSFLKVQAVSWPIDAMLVDVLRERFAQRGLTLAPVAPTDALTRARESCFVNASLADGLPKSCAAPLTEQASSAGVSYLILMAPGLNDANHAGSARIEGVTAMMRGWGVLTRERATAKERPVLFNEVELLLVSVGPEGVQLRARQWGGLYTSQWQTYTPPSDPHQIPTEQLDELRPAFSALLARQATALMDQVRVEP
jgi:hypothetical protein